MNQYKYLSFFQNIVNKILIDQQFISIIYIINSRQMPIISQTQIELLSNNYTHLKCRVYDKTTKQLISSHLINSCIPTLFNINRKPNNFSISLYNDENVLIQQFEFDEKQFKINKVRKDNYYEGEGYSSKIVRKKVIKNSSYNLQEEQSDYEQEVIRVEKQADSCSICLTVYRNRNKMDDLLKIFTSMNQSDRLRSIAAMAYRRIEERALKIIKKKQQNSRRHSMQINTPGKQVRKSPNISLNSTVNGYFANRIDTNKSTQFMQTLKKIQLDKAIKQKQNNPVNLGIWSKLDKQFKETIQQSNMKQGKNKKLFCIKQKKLLFNKIRLVSQENVPRTRQNIQKIGQEIINYSGFIKVNQQPNSLKIRGLTKCTPNHWRNGSDSLNRRMNKQNLNKKPREMSSRPFFNNFRSNQTYQNCLTLP